MDATSSCRVTAASLFDAWRNACKARERILWEAWDAPAEFTNHVLYAPDSAIQSVAAEVGLSAYAEYYKLDAVLYQPDDLVPGRPAGQTWVRRIRVALEHENFFNSGLFQEISHLLITDCDLRVLVTYPPPKCDPRDEMNRLHTIVSGSDRAPAIAAEQSLMVIFGRTSEENSQIDWSAFVFGADRWLPL